MGKYLDTEPGLYRQLWTAVIHGPSTRRSARHRTDAEAVCVFADYCAGSAYRWDHYRDGRRRRIGVLVRTLSDRVGVSPTRLLAKVNAAGPVPFEESHSVTPRPYPWVRGRAPVR